MSHNQDVNMVLWSKRGEALGEVLNKLRSSSMVMPSTGSTDQDVSGLSSENEQRTVFIEQPA